MCQTHIYRLLYSLIQTGYNMGVHRICKWGVKNLWCEYLWVGTSPFGGLGILPQEIFLNMKCSRSDFRPILCILRVSS